MANKKIEKALYGPSTVEVALGAILGLIAGLLAACVFLVFKPVQTVKELPKEQKDQIRGVVYYIAGSDNATKGKAYVAKQKIFIGGANVVLNEDELNAWSAATFVAAPAAPAAGKPGAPAPAAAAAAGPAYDGIINPDRPNFKIKDDTLQIGFKCVLNWYGLTHEVMVVTTGTIKSSGEGFVYSPTTLFLGSCPVHLIPGAAKPLLAHLLSKKKAPDEINSAWAKATDVTIEGSNLKITMQ